ncbi:MAG: nucleoside deaminase [Muribaculaceae bacterium]|nr:nucleoside deaminase [Muribaculaceae bacterium]
MTTKDDERWMRVALDEAHKAQERDEVPIGAVVVSRGRIVARGHNLTETLTDVTAHAEMQAITAAAGTLGGKYLTDCTLYVTVEPCLMCAGALGWSQVSRVVYGAGDDKRGYHTFCDHPFHKKTVVEGGVLAEECAQLMTEFFKKKRR